MGSVRPLESSYLLVRSNTVKDSRSRLLVQFQNGCDGSNHQIGFSLFCHSQDMINAHKIESIVTKWSCDTTHFVSL